MSKGGIRAGRGCNDHIFAVRQIVEKTIAKDKLVYLAFVDLDIMESAGRIWC